MRQFLPSCEEPGFTAGFVNLRYCRSSDTPERLPLNCNTSLITKDMPTSKMLECMDKVPLGVDEIQRLYPDALSTQNGIK